MINYIELTKQALIQLATDYENAYFHRFPELGAFWGKMDVDFHRFMDHSLHAEETWQEKEDDFLAKLNQLDEKALKGSSEHITFLLLKQHLEANLALRICQDPLWDINPLWGWHNQTTTTAEKQPVGTNESREAALERWQAFPQMVNEEIHKLSIGLKRGFLAPRTAVERVLKQIEILITTPIGDSPYYSMAQRDLNPKFQQQIVELIETTIYPALKKYARFLSDEYFAFAREAIGIAALPSGKAGYAAKVKKETTLTIAPEEIHHLGLQHMESLVAEIRAIGEKHYGLKEVVAIFKQAKQDPAGLFHSEEEMLAYNQAALMRAKSTLHHWFKHTPQTEGILKPYPLHRAMTGAPGEYHPPSRDGRIPGIFYINTYEAHKKNKIDQEATLFHELIPGHHLQIALDQEMSSHHSLNRYLWNAGFGEGWALYSERLSDEMGLYTSDFSRLGMLSNEAMRTARLVVDPGIHVMGWTKDQAITYLLQHTALEHHMADSEVDRYTMMAGQATSYLLGKFEIDRLRQLCQMELQYQFDIREFHQQILKNGAITLPMLNRQILDWLATFKI